MEIGRAERVDLREIWKNEARDFIPWLEDNIEVLSENLGIVMRSPEREKGAGDFKADILAEDEHDRPVVIECQLGRSDHDHLGKILTYMTNLECKTAVWICSDPRPEHVATVNWLNEITPVGTSLYMVKVEAIRIKDSPPAPIFYVVGGPSREAKEIGEKKAEIAERHLKRLEFWKGLLAKARKRTKLHANLKPSKESWLATSLGVPGCGLVYLIGIDWSGVELYIDGGKDSEEYNRKIFEELFKHKEEVEQVFGEPLVWDPIEGRRACRIRWRHEGEGLQNEDLWDEIQERMIERMIKLDEALKPHLKKLRKKHELTGNNEE